MSAASAAGHGAGSASARRSASPRSSRRTPARAAAITAASSGPAEPAGRHPGSRAAEQGGHPLGGGQPHRGVPGHAAGQPGEEDPPHHGLVEIPAARARRPRARRPGAGGRGGRRDRPCAGRARLSRRRAAPSGRGQRTAGLLAEPHSLAAVADPPEVREGEVVPGIQHDRHAGSGPLRAARTRRSGSLTGGAGRRPAASSARPASPASSAMAPSRHSAAVASRR